jgi:hypothetical protein
MINTYINDNVNVPYPFFGMGSLPFPMCCIVGFGICIHGPLTGLIFISSLEITNSSIKAVVVMGSTILGTVECRSYSGNRTSAIQATQSDVQLSGFMTIGDIPKTAIGHYDGVFPIDPSCITNMPDAVFGYHRAVEINGTSYTIGQQLEISASGLLSISGNTIQGTNQVTSANLTTFDYMNDYSMVKTVNGMSFHPHTESNIPTLTFKTDYPDCVKFDVIGGAGMPEEGDVDEGIGDVTVLVINGTKKFPNCYKQEDDEAL